MNRNQISSYIFLFEGGGGTLNLPGASRAHYVSGAGWGWRGRQMPEWVECPLRGRNGSVEVCNHAPQRPCWPAAEQGSSVWGQAPGGEGGGWCWPLHGWPQIGLWGKSWAQVFAILILPVLLPPSFSPSPLPFPFPSPHPSFFFSPTTCYTPDLSEVFWSSLSI